LGKRKEYLKNKEIGIRSPHPYAPPTEGNFEKKKEIEMPYI
jgi:hypothetical protein